MRRSACPASSSTDHLVPLFGSVASIGPDFLDKHPGGSKILQRYAGKNATKAFWKFHKENVLKKQAERYKIGVISESARL